MDFFLSFSLLIPLVANESKPICIHVQIKVNEFHFEVVEKEVEKGTEDEEMRLKK